MPVNLQQEADLLESFTEITTLSDCFASRLTAETRVEKFLKKQLILEPGQVARRLYFVRKGLLRSYLIDKDGKKHTTWFFGKGDLMIAIKSFHSQTPSTEYIEVLEDCKLESISWRQLSEYYQNFNEANVIGRIITQRYYLLSEEKSIMLRHLDPEKRYEDFIKLHPNIEYETTQLNIASYLNITRETLSRIKSRSLKNKSTSKQIFPTMISLDRKC